MLSTDKSQLSLGDAAGLPGLIAQGGSLRIVAVGGDGFAKTYPLDAAQWRLIQPRRPGKGVYYADKNGPITKVQFEAGKRLLVQGKGAELEQSLGAEPSQVLVTLRIGSRLYCLAFGGTHKEFARKSKLHRTGSEAPATCPAKDVGGSASRADAPVIVALD
jgi:hypothetical protein